jgi:hypothetical protein
MKRFLILILMASVGPLSFPKSAGATEPQLKNFLTRRVDKLFDGDREYRFISFNIPNLMVIEDAYEFTHPNPWRWPNDYEIEDSLESIRQMGGQVVRTYVLSVHRDGSDMGDVVHVRGPGEFNEEGFRALDQVIEVARRKGIRVIIPFVDQAKWWGGIGEYAAFRNKPADAFWTDPQIRDDFKATVRYLINRKNTLTGVAYRDEPAIFGWETGNEINSPPEWTHDVAAYIKQLDSNHLVLDGNSLHGVPKASLDDPNIDVITTHHYPFGADHDFAKPIRAAHALTKGKKAYVVGEFGFVETSQLAAAIQTVIDEGISGALLWSLRMHRREGGFYWHMEVGTGRNIYKAFHWPGFASGDRYDERSMMKLMREKAFEIRGIQPSQPDKPAPPTLLKIESVNAISWQGSAGATSYDVQRAPSPDGPWTSIAKDLSDADVQYRPLFNDGSAIPGKQYWYRVVARNSAGDSAPSNVFGPVAVKHHTLVDECRDTSLAVSTTGNVSLTSDNARTAQEDCHRLALKAGASIVYQVEEPIQSFRVFSFSNENSTLSFESSEDGKQYRNIEVERSAFAAGQTVYGYLTPILYAAKLSDAKTHFLKISNNSDAKGGSPSTVELSRIEIDYGGTTAPADAASKRTGRKAAQLSASVFVDCNHSLDEALAGIDAADARGERQVNVVATILVDLTDDLHVKSFGEFAGDEHAYQPFDNKMRAALREKLRAVFARMAQHNMSIYVLPHIDAGGEVQQWRNWVDFDPLEHYAGCTYADLLLGTIIDAAIEGAPAARLELALSGEMGTSLFRYPQSYRKVIQQLRANSRMKNLKLGISLNHGGIAGQRNPVTKQELPFSEQQRRQMQELIEDCDFVGMSFYAPVSVSPTPDDFVRGIDRFMGEFRQLGLSVPTTKPMQFSEVGIGGRRSRAGKQPRPTEAVAAPWEGTATPDENPWRHEPMRALRRRYHTALLQFLNEQPAPWRVEAVFVWSMGSWDPIGLAEPEFADTEIVSAIERHNRSVAE